MNNYQFLLKSLATLVTTLFCLNAIAQEEQSAAVGGEEKAEAGGFIEEVVVTGSGGGNLTALETSYGVAILDADDIRKGSPDGLADLVDAVLGLQGELSQGRWLSSNMSPDY